MRKTIVAVLLSIAVVIVEVTIIVARNLSSTRKAPLAQDISITIMVEELAAMELEMAAIPAVA